MKEDYESKPLSNPRRKSAYYFIAVILIVIVGVIIGVEAVRRLSPQLTSETPRAGSESAVNNTGGAFPRQLRDGSGQLLSIDARPQRIVSQTLGTDEILLAICAPERIVALSKFALDPKYSNSVAKARATGAPIVRTTEEILQLKPDLIFVASYSRAETVEQLQSTGGRVFRLANFDRLEDLKQNIRVIGKSIGDEDRAEALVAQMEREIDAIRARVLALGSKQPRVMSYSSAGTTAGGKTLFDDILRTVGAINVTAENGLEGFRKVSAEQVAAWQPDFIVTGADTDKFEETKQQLLANPAVAATEAARAGRIIVIDNRSFLTVSHHVVDIIRGSG